MKKDLRQFTVRLTKDDHIKLVYQAKKLNISQAEFLRELIRKNLLYDIKEYNELLDDLRKATRNLSNNINQIAKKINSTAMINELDEAEKLHEEIVKIWQLLKS
ncbi:plasmid mobilization protein [Fusobacterium mortiferum]|uniref:plasmid mobilization protein n=1 Tax=Fusobacterium mortiferum TaxID=850 RepID=UPI0022E005DC|nr:plasmid mobilization relaxosome protein MobC [Fusobacterium mortiferum]